MNGQSFTPSEDEYFRHLDQSIRNAIKGKCIVCTEDIQEWNDAYLDEHENIVVILMEASLKNYGDIEHLDESFIDMIRWGFQQGDFIQKAKELNHHLCQHCSERLIQTYRFYLHNMPYKDYLKSHEWHKTRNRKLKSAQNRCQLCNSKKSLNVHHRTYERRGYEDDEDLIVLCNHCHAKFHDKLPENE